MSTLRQRPHRRYNPLLREWVLVSPHRTQRPWQGHVESVATPAQQTYDPKCYLCPGNERAGGHQNPAYESTFVFDNDYPALRLEDSTLGQNERGVLVAQSESGICRVVCFAPQHDLTMSRMSPDELRRVIDVWVLEYRALGKHALINYVQIFENRGAMMGASNPHPHGQIWASQSVPNQPALEQSALSEYHKTHGTCLLCTYVDIEAKAQVRIVTANEHFVAVVPYWAVWPFEVLLLSRRHVASMGELSAEDRDALGSLLKEVTTRYDNVFQVPFPYSMGFHQAPTDSREHPEWHLHAHFYPPLLRSAAVRKFMVGYEMLGGPQRDITAESAASRLRDVGTAHYTTF